MSAAEKPSNDPTGPAGLADVIMACSRAPDALAELAQIYRTADAEVAELTPACRGCGECCNFPRAGHRLYVTGIELAYLLSSEPPQPDQANEGLCPYQRGTRCTTRDTRPLGCRMYFCDQDLPAPLQAIHERHHRQIRRLHERFGIDYLYCELTSSIRTALADGP